MNFVYLAKKYLGVDCLCDDRTYGGLIWPVKQGDKPPYETFEAFQKEEDRANRVDRKISEQAIDEKRLEHRRVQQKALEDIVPYEHKVRLEHEEIRKETQAQRRAAIDLQQALDARDEVAHTWREIAAADDRVTKEAEQYLADTAKYLSWDPHKIPTDILEKREEAHRRIDQGKEVYGQWQELRKNEMPTRQEMIEAIRAGGEQLERLKKICKEAALKYPKPRKTHF